MIPVLPRQQLLSQWRECCCIAKNIAENGTPNHILVNKITAYPSTHFIAYCNKVLDEMSSRGYKVDLGAYLRMTDNLEIAVNKGYFEKDVDLRPIYAGWHDERYLIQCYYNLQEKYDCGGISEDEWKRIETLKEALEVD